MLSAGNRPGTSETDQPTFERCGSCHHCAPQGLFAMRMILCVKCGNKRCPHATDCFNACTGSNEPNQPGSVYGPQHTSRVIDEPPVLSAPVPTRFDAGDGTTIERTSAIGAPQARWAVRNCGMCLSIEGVWEVEPMPSSRDASFLAGFRFTSVEAAWAAIQADRASAAD